MVNWKYHRETNFGGLSGTLFLSPDGVPTIIGKASKQITLHRPLDDQLEHWELLTEVVPTFGPGQDGKRMSEKHWDPDAWVEGNTTYILITAHPLSPKGQPALFKTTDMKTFHFVDYFLDVDVPGVARTSDIKTNDDLSCPSFFPIGNKWMILCISHNKGCRYYLGEWKDEKFIPDYHGWMNCRMNARPRPGRRPSGRTTRSPVSPLPMPAPQIPSLMVKYRSATPSRRK